MVLSGWKWGRKCEGAGGWRVEGVSKFILSFELERESGVCIEKGWALQRILEW